MPVAISELTGQPVDTNGEAWRAECEARAVLKMPNRYARNDFLALVAKRRGQEAADQLRSLAERMHNLLQRRTAEAPTPPPPPPKPDHPDLFAA